MKPKSLLTLLTTNAHQWGLEAAVHFKDAGEYVSWTWRQVLEETRALSKGLIALGIASGDRVSLVSNTRLEWVLADLGIVGAGGVTVPIFPDSVADDVRYVLDHSGSRIAIVEDPTQVAKLRAERHRLPQLEKVIQLEGRVYSGDDDWVISLEELKNLGDTITDAQLRFRWDSVTPKSIYTLIYTSGTTGRPKGVITTHKSMLYVAGGVQSVNVIQESDVQLLFLPLAHVFGRVLMVSWLQTRHELAFAESATTLRENLHEVRPTLLCGVPRVFEKIYSEVVHGVANKGPIAQSFLLRALLFSKKAEKVEANTASQSDLNRLYRRGFRWALSKTIGRKMNDVLGGRIRLLISGGAPLSQEIGWFFKNLGFEILEGYGLTETAAATCVGRPDITTVGSVGLPLPGTEIRLGDDAEILIRGPGLMMGYWKDPKATQAVFEDGWLKTGDLGEIDDGGGLTITGRKKDIIVTAGGKNISPQNIEKRFRCHPLFADVVVHGDRRKYLSALITLDPEALQRLSSKLGYMNEPYSVQTQLPGVRRHVERVVGLLNAELSAFETIKAFRILEKSFSPGTGEVTPTLKVKRAVIYERYSRVFDALYPEPYL